MDKFRVLFFFGLLTIVILIARFSSNPTSHPESPTFPTPAPQTASTSVVAPPSAAPSPSAPAAPSQPHPANSAELKKASEHALPAVVLISVFDESGRLLRSGSGFFVSDDGRIVTSKFVVEGAANAIAKTSDGKFYNVSGILADASALDIAVLKADSKKKVPFVVPSKAATPEVGTRIGVIASPLVRRKPALLEAAVSGRKSDQSGEWLELSATIPNDSVGSPVINEMGEVVGVATSQHAPGALGNIVRPATALEPLLAQLEAGVATGWQWSQKFPQEPEPPAQAPPSPTPQRFAKIPTVQTNQPGSRLIFSPKPKYPTSARHSFYPLKGSGRYRVTFNASGAVTNVEIIESSRSHTLDSAAADALRRWKAAPGQEWTATVPVTFEP